MLKQLVLPTDPQIRVCWIIPANENQIMLRSIDSRRFNKKILAAFSYKTTDPTLTEQGLLNKAIKKNYLTYKPPMQKLGTVTIDGIQFNMFTTSIENFPSANPKNVVKIEKELLMQKELIIQVGRQPNLATEALRHAAILFANQRMLIS